MTAADTSSSDLRVLMIGAGAVGQIYADHLVRGGARVTFYVRERYREEVRAGFTIVPLARRQRVHRLEQVPVISSVGEVAATRFDQVYLAIPSTGLTSPWLNELIASIGEATIVGLTPSPDDRERLLAAGASPERLVAGLISLVSYHAPLPGEDREAGMAVWYPPGSPSLFSGPPEIARDVVAALRRGNLPARVAADVPAKGAFLSSVFMAMLLGLEAAGWSFRAMRGEALRAALAGARQAMAITARTFGPPPLAMRVLLRAPLVRVGLWLAPRFVPFPLETYVRVHFTKVGAQTRHIVRVTLERGERAGLAVDALAKLLAAAPSPAPGAPRASGAA